MWRARRAMGVAGRPSSVSRRCRARCRACRRRGRRRSSPATPASPRCRRRVRPLPRDGRERVVAEVAGVVSGLRAIAASMTGASRLALLARRGLVALDELGQHLAPEQLDRLHDVLVAVAPGLQHEDHLVDAGLLVAAQVLADLVGRADRAAQAGGVAGRHLGAEPLLLDRPGDRLRVEALRGPPLRRTRSTRRSRRAGARRTRRSGRGSSRRSWRPRRRGGWPRPRRGAASSGSRRPPAG